jgi:hypothetical protein
MNDNVGYALKVGGVLPALSQLPVHNTVVGAMLHTSGAPKCCVVMIDAAAIVDTGLKAGFHNRLLSGGYEAATQI